MKAGRPVRLCLSLDESLLTLTKHAGILVLKTGVTKDGRLTARKSEIQLDGGAYSDASALTVVKTGYRITGPYRWDAVATRLCGAHQYGSGRVVSRLWRNPGELCVGISDRYDCAAVGDRPP